MVVSYHSTGGARALKYILHALDRTAAWHRLCELVEVLPPTPAMLSVGVLFTSINQPAPARFLSLDVVMVRFFSGGWTCTAKNEESSTRAWCAGRGLGCPRTCTPPGGESFVGKDRYRLIGNAAGGGDKPT